MVQSAADALRFVEKSSVNTTNFRVEWRLNFSAADHIVRMYTHTHTHTYDGYRLTTVYKSSVTGVNAIGKACHDGSCACVRIVHVFIDPLDSNCSFQNVIVTRMMYCYCIKSHHVLHVFHRGTRMQSFTFFFWKFHIPHVRSVENDRSLLHVSYRSPWRYVRTRFVLYNTSLYDPRAHD